MPHFLYYKGPGLSYESGASLLPQTGIEPVRVSLPTGF